MKINCLSNSFSITIAKGDNITYMAIVNTCIYLIFTGLPLVTTCNPVKINHSSLIILCFNQSNLINYCLDQCKPGQRILNQCNRIDQCLFYNHTTVYYIYCMKYISASWQTTLSLFISNSNHNQFSYLVSLYYKFIKINFSMVYLHLLQGLRLLHCS